MRGECEGLVVVRNKGALREAGGPGLVLASCLRRDLTLRLVRSVGVTLFPRNAPQGVERRLKVN